MSAFTDATLQQVKRQLELRNELYKQFVRKYGSTSWEEVAYNVKTGKAARLYNVGDILACNYRYYTNATDYVDYVWPWVISKVNDTAIWEDQTEHPAIALQSQFCTIESIPFDAPEKVACDPETELTAEDGIYYFGATGNNFTALNLSTGDTIPYSGYDAVYKNDVNNTAILGSGYNNWKLGCIRQWLNSAADRGEWWEAQHVGDAAPTSQVNQYRGFMAGLDADFLGVINPVRVRTARNTVTDGGGYDDTYDRFYLPSIEEMYGAPQLEDVEGPYVDYWKEISGLSAPGNGAAAGRIIKDIVSQTTAQNCRLRSAYRGNSNTAWNVATAGGLSNYSASYAYRCAPACKIS